MMDNAGWIEVLAIAAVFVAMMVGLIWVNL